MYGSVIGTNPSKGLVLAETDSGYYILFELLEESPIFSGDLLQGNLETHGWQMLFNKTRCRELDVVIRDRLNSYRDACMMLEA